MEHFQPSQSGMLVSPGPRDYGMGKGVLTVHKVVGVLWVACSQEVMQRAGTQDDVVYVLWMLVHDIEETSKPTNTLHKTQILM